jgi:BON domain
MPERTEDYTAAHVQEALARDPRVSEPELEVQIVGGRVIVTGVVPTDERHEGVDAVVRESCPDLEVDNRTTVGRYPDAGEAERVR